MRNSTTFASGKYTKLVISNSVSYFCVTQCVNIMSIVGRIQEYIAREIELPQGARIVVGLSGGADSVALLSLLCKMGYDCIACHCNFMLRGEESVRDRNHAHDIACRLQLPFVETIFDTTGYAAENGLSIEMAARELRYKWFEAMRIEHKADAIAVAHHRDDNTETVLINLVRGTGLVGLTGMSPRNGHIVRPLLCVSRDELLAYLEQEQLSYVTDSTNLEAIYTRNKLRLEVMPLLRNINPSVDVSLNRTITYLRDSEKFYRESINRWREQVTSLHDNELHIDLALLHSSPSPATLLHEIVAPMGFAAQQVEAMLSAHGASGRRFISATHRVVTHRNVLIVTKVATVNEDDVLAQWNEGDVTSQCGLALSIHDAQGYEIVRRSDTACFDSDSIHYPLTLRRWRQGDRFTPFGMKGKKKVSDYFTDHKFSLTQKENCLILCDSERILWIVGHRAAHEARITHATRKVLQIVVEGK